MRLKIGFWVSPGKGHISEKNMEIIEDFACEARMISRDLSATMYDVMMTLVY